MAEHHHVVEHTDTGTGTATGMIIGIVVLLLVAILAFFFLFGGPGRSAPVPTGQTNVNIPAQQAPQQPSGPNIQVPRQIDVNVNQPPAQQAPVQQAPVQQAPAQQGPAR